MEWLLPGKEDLDALWRTGVRDVVHAYRGLPVQVLEPLKERAARLRELRLAMQALVAGIGAATHCADCGGECCVAGKYHFTKIDLLVYLVEQEPLFAPLFNNGLCPYLAPGGCLIEPAYRPFNCITFNCERIEDLLSEKELAGFYRMERELRRVYGEIRSLFTDDSMHGAVLADSPAKHP